MNAKPAGIVDEPVTGPSEGKTRPMTRSKLTPFAPVTIVALGWLVAAVVTPASASARALDSTYGEVLAPRPAHEPSLDLATGDPASWFAVQTEPESQWEGGGALSGEAPRRLWAVLASAAVPGLGEALTGRWLRGGALIAADAVVWSVRIDKNGEGDDLEAEYKEFALENWSQDAWARAVGGDPDSTIDANFDLWREAVGAVGATTIDDIALYVSRAEDEREWFENAGKWDVFAWGWREFHDAAYMDATYGTTNPRFAEVYRPDPLPEDFQEGDPDPRDFWFDRSDALRTPLRDEYVGIRNASNDAYETRDQMTTVLLLTRVFSVLQMAYLEGFVGGRYDAPVPATEGPSSRGLGLTSFGLTGTGLAWKVTY